MIRAFLASAALALLSACAQLPGVTALEERGSMRAYMVQSRGDFVDCLRTSFDTDDTWNFFNAYPLGPINLERDQKNYTDLSNIGQFGNVFTYRIRVMKTGEPFRVEVTTSQLGAYESSGSVHARLAQKMGACGRVVAAPRNA
jgi:hypothetical protein